MKATDARTKLHGLASPERAAWSSRFFKTGPGQELSEHTAAKPAMRFFVTRAATLGLGDDTQGARAGTWVHMPTNLKHSVKAKTPVVMLLMLLK